MAITLNTAQAMIERARGHATSIGVPMNIAVTDGGGHVLAFARMDGAILGSIVAVIGADDGKYRNVWPPSIEDLIKQVEENAWIRPVQPVPAAAGV